jgi:tetratricopeptide (TPR) repeat protein
MYRRVALSRAMSRKQRRAEAWGQGRAAAPTGPTAQWLNAALAHQRAGRAAEAERMCRQILVIDPDHVHALHLLGLIEHQLGRSDMAIARIRKAIMRYGGDPPFTTISAIFSADKDCLPTRWCATSRRSPSPGLGRHALQPRQYMPEPRPSKAGDRLFRSRWPTDFAETAAAVSHLDLVITVDTATAHLAGALTRPTWVMLPTAPD